MSFLSIFSLFHNFICQLAQPRFDVTDNTIRLDKSTLRKSWIYTLPTSDWRIWERLSHIEHGHKWYDICRHFPSRSNSKILMKPSCFTSLKGLPKLRLPLCKCNKYWKRHILNSLDKNKIILEKERNGEHVRNKVYFHYLLWHVLSRITCFQCIRKIALTARWWLKNANCMNT